MRNIFAIFAFIFIFLVLSNKSIVSAVIFLIFNVILFPIFFIYILIVGLSICPLGFISGKFKITLNIVWMKIVRLVLIN